MTKGLRVIPSQSPCIPNGGGNRSFPEGRRGLPGNGDAKAQMRSAGRCAASWAMRHILHTLETAYLFQPWRAARRSASG
jgi:hypothetical protein